MPTRRTVVAGLAAMIGTAARALPEPPVPGVRRAYLDGPFGQLHMRIASPASAPAAAPLVLMHQSPLSGRMFDRLLPLLAAHRTVIAVDTPGYGESDRPATPPTLAAYGDAIIDTLGKANAAPFDLLGYHTGAVIAADLAARRPRQIRRLVLVSVPYFDAARRRALLDQLAIDTDYAADGSHLLPLWTGAFRVKPQGQSLDDVARLVAEKQRAGRFGEWALAAAMAADMTPTLRAVRHPTLVLAPHDGLEKASHAAAGLIPNARLVDLPALSYGLFDSAPQELASRMAAFLDSTTG